jgi:hypothetical protein
MQPAARTEGGDDGRPAGAKPVAAFPKAEVRLRTRLTCPAGSAGAMKPYPADNPENKNTKEQKGTEENTKEHSFLQG